MIRKHSFVTPVEVIVINDKLDYGHEGDRTTEFPIGEETAFSDRREERDAHDGVTASIPTLESNRPAITSGAEETVQPPSRRSGAWRTISISFASAIIGGLVVLGALAGYSALKPPEAPRIVSGFSGNRPVVSSNQTGKLLAPQEIYERFGPAVVQITATVTQYSRDFFGIPYGNRGNSEGSGFVIDEQGYIVTNAHVVDNADQVTVTLNDKTKLDAKVVGIDRSSDLALLKVDPGSERLSVIQLGDSSQVRVGDTVYAIGNPFGHLAGSMSSGIVSAVGRQIEAPNGFTIRNVIQTDAAVNPGNSGGPLIDAFGQVIGINAQIEARSEQFAGVAFAIPSNTVTSIVAELKGRGKASHAWLGIQGSDITSDVAGQHDLPTKTGVMITNVVAGSPADKAGLRGFEQAATGRIAIGDILVEFDGSKVASMEDLLSLVEKKKVGDKVRLVVYRDGKRQTLSITLGERPAELQQRQ